MRNEIYDIKSVMKDPLYIYIYGDKLFELGDNQNLDPKLMDVLHAKKISLPYVIGRIMIF